MVALRHLLPVLALCCILIVAAPSVAIHEDEQGLRDWILRLVGHVEHATVAYGRSLENVFVTSSQGAVAALVLQGEKGGSLRWRQLLSDPQVCVAADRERVAVSSSDGKVHFLSAATGAVMTTFKLALPPGAHVVSCIANRSTFKFSALANGTAHLYDLDAASDEMEFIAPSAEMPIGADAARWEAGVDTAQLMGRGGAVEGRVTASAAAGGAVAVAFPDGAVRVEGQTASAAAGAPAVLLAVRDAARGPVALLRVASGHLVAVAQSGGFLWERLEGLAALAATVIVQNPWNPDRFSFTNVAIGVSRYGIVYIIPVMGMGEDIEVLADVSELLLSKTGAPAMEDVRIARIVTTGEHIVSVMASFKERHVTIVIDVSNRKILDAKLVQDALLVAPSFDITRSLEVRGELPREEMHLFTVNVSTGVLQGYLASATTSMAMPLWTVRLPSSIIAHASGEDELRTSFVNHLRVFPNRTGTEPQDDVRRKYPTRNVVAVAHYEASEEELTTLVITAIDTITGSVLGTSRHRNVEGPVHMLIVEHAILYHYMDAAKMRHCIGVWEMFEEEPGAVMKKEAGATLPQVIASFLLRAKRTFSSHATRAPVVTVNVLGVQGGDVATLGLTTSFGSIARKTVIFAFESGRIAAIEINRLLAGGQMPLDDKGTLMTHVIIPSTSLVSHKYRVALPNLVATEPSELESSCHVLVSGLDLFYVRASSGKAFDLLNSDFNKNLLIMLTGGFVLLCLVVRHFVKRKGLNLMWK